MPFEKRRVDISLHVGIVVLVHIIFTIMRSNEEKKHISIQYTQFLAYRLDDGGLREPAPEVSIVVFQVLSISLETD
jgi:hypothetical protein